MTPSRLSVLKPYDHLVDNIDHVVLDGTVGDLREGDIVLDGMFWARSISRGTHNSASARTVQLAPLEAPGINIGRLVLTDGAPIVFARPVEFETWDPQTTDMIPSLNYDSATATLTSDLAEGDFVGWIEGSRLDEDAECRLRRVLNIWPNGLIQFDDGAYQSAPSFSWYVIDFDPRGDDQVLLKVKRDLVCDSAHAFVDSNDKTYVGTSHESPFIQWRDVQIGDVIRYETEEIPKAARARMDITTKFPTEASSQLFEEWCDEANLDSPFFHDRKVESFRAGSSYDEIIVSFDDDLGDLATSMRFYTTWVPSKSLREE